MTLALALLPLALTLSIGQVPGSRQSSTGPGASIDPILFPELRDAVERASAAELDPKRGPSNAAEILRAEKSKVAPGSPAAIGLDLRIAATSLRARFLGLETTPKPDRAAQALSTFARLDLAEPGLVAWLDRALAERPELKKTIGKPGSRRLRVAILSRSSAIDRQAVLRAFDEALARVGATIELVPAQDASLVLTVGAEDLPRPSEGDVAVKVTLGLDSIQAGKIVWKNALYRVEAAKDPKVALDAALGWLARIGGRDLFFRWLGEHGFEILTHIGEPPGRPGAHEH